MKIMAKIQVSIVILDDGVFLIHKETGLLFSCIEPYDIIGRYNKKTRKIERCKI